ncbi:MAG: Kelch repeat-containing protein, partial [Planctomycetota bacterium]
PTLLFSDGFQGDLSGWTVCGSATPSIAIGAGNPGNALRAGGGAASSGEAVSLRVFSTGAGLSIAGDLRVGALGASNCQVWMGLRDAAACDGLQRLDAGILIDSSTGSRQYIVNNAVSFSDLIPNTQWNRYRIVIRSDCRVEFYAGGALVHVSVAPMGGGGLWRPISLGGRDLGGAAEADNIEVTGQPPFGATQFQSGFAMGALTPVFTTSNGGSGLNPSIDASSDGQPAPSFNPGGGAGGSGEALSAATFDATKPLEIRADLRVPVTSTANAAVWAGLEGGNVSASADGIPDLAAGVIVDANVAVNAVRYVMYVSGSQSVVMSRPLDTQWHSYRIVLRPDFHIEWYRDGLLEFVSAAPTGNALGNLSLSLGGRSSGANTRADNVAVITPPLGEALAMRQLSPTGTPPVARMWHGASFDPQSDSVIVTGGWDNSNTRNDVWRLDLSQNPATGQWTQMSPAGTAPVGIDGHVQVYDPIRRRILIFGGFDGTGVNNDLWELDLSTANGQWTQLTPSGTAPAGVWGATGVFDTTNDRLVVFGGEDNSAVLQGGVITVQFSAVSPAGAWGNLTPSGTAPTAREFCPGVYDPASRTMIIGPGDDGTGPMASGGEFYSLTLSPLGSEAWQQLSPGSPPSPPSVLPGPGLRRMSGLALWPAERRIFMFGGEDPGSATFYPPPAATNEAWTMDLSCLNATPNAWFAGGPTATPPTPRRAHTMVFDAKNRRAIVFGGEDATPTLLNDVWELALP